MPTATLPTTDVAAAHRLLDEAEALLRRWDTPLEAAILAVVDRRVTGEVGTMAVRLRADGVATLLVNPMFVVDVGADGAAFVLCHEALHLLFSHLRYRGLRDDAWRLGCEVVVNHWVTLATGRPLPRSADTGLPVGIDPQQVHASLAQISAGPIGYNEFVRTDEGCAAHLRAAPAAIAPTGCHHLDGEPDGSDAGAAGEQVVEEVLERAVQRATDGDGRIRQQLLDLDAIAPGAPMLARVGVPELRATSARLGDTRLWQAQLAHVLGRHLQPDLVVRYDRKTGWWDAALLRSLGFDVDPSFAMPLHHVAGTGAERRVAVYLDTSGSISPETLDAVAATVGEVPDTVVAWHTFDTEVHPFEPGEPLPGGGGTDFAPIEADLGEDLDAYPDAVVVLTDGYAVPIQPPHPDRWIWLILEHGDTWPRDHGMRTVTIPDPPMVTPSLLADYDEDGEF
jgi:hypothetical protein